MTESSPLVRPLGYVDAVPVVRRVGSRPLFLGNVHAADGSRHDRTFDFVLSATREAHPLTTHHRPLVDGEGTDWEGFERAVETTRGLLRRDGSVLVHCKSGISRSSTLVATALAAEADRSFRDGLAAVHEARPLAMPHPALHELAAIYLASRR